MPMRTLPSPSSLTAIGVLACLAAAPAPAQAPLRQAVLSTQPASTAGFASVPGGVAVTWSETRPDRPLPRNVLRAVRLDERLSTRLSFAVANDRSGPETYFQCPVVARVGEDRMVFAWLATTTAGRRIAYRMTTLDGALASPVRYAEKETPERDAFCPQVDGWTGGFALSWPSGPRTGPLISFYARSFDRNGAPVSPRVQMQAEAPAVGFPAGIAVDRRGHFTVSWTILGPGGSFPARLRMRRFLRNGIPTAGPIDVSTRTTESAALSRFGRGAHEGVEIVWRSPTESGPGSIRVQRFDRQLRPLAPSREVARSGVFGLPVLRVDDAGRSAIGWEPEGTRQNGLFVDATLAPCGRPFPLQIDRAVSAVNLAFSARDQIAAGLVEENAQNIRRLVVRSYSLSSCPEGGVP